MNTRSSAHVHTNFCDGRAPAEEMVRSALERGFVSLGFSSHAPQRFGAPCCVAPERENEYKAEILRLKEKYVGQIALYLGMERDLFACAGPEGYDYCIASTHYFPVENDYVAIDGRAGKLAAYMWERLGGDGLALARAYFTQLRDYALSFRPQIIGHFDLLRKNNAALHFVDEESPAYRKIALDALDALRGRGALLEVNTGAIARGYLSTPYPAEFLLRAWLEWGEDIILNSDCHDPRFLDAAYDETEARLRALGFREATRLSAAGDGWERYAL